MISSERTLKVLISTLWILLIFVFSTVLKPNISIEKNILFPHADKLAHFVMYFILQLLLMYQYENRICKRKELKIFISVCTYGILLEVFQHLFLADRFYEIFDIIANITGAFSGMLFFHFIKT